MHLCITLSFIESMILSMYRMKEHLFIFVLDRFVSCFTGDYSWKPVLIMSTSLSSARQLFLAASSVSVQFEQVCLAQTACMQLRVSWTCMHATLRLSQTACDCLPASPRFVFAFEAEFQPSSCRFSVVDVTSSDERRSPSWDRSDGLSVDKNELIISFPT